ncbi:DapH/DapD/GlmU-related protein [Corynebacterium belfantii]|uniref:DapH/DapD/GlmU-related protein n=1 Tax=Corynebacterium belfantii TaxID=2014537 RepID=UPI001F2F488A|nr:DapH/DapD/GlmU-related protein [Corynebacterium belfantii]
MVFLLCWQSRLRPRRAAIHGVYRGAITIQDHVWLGGNCTVTAGVTIGHGAVIGAGSVVTRDIPPMVLAAGNPCRVIRDIGPEDKLMGESWVPEWPSWITD